jgi:peroxiredoxin Q/BCP
VVGISADRPKAQSRFAERLELSYPMLCDPEGEVLRAYGVRGIAGYAKRVSFLLDAEGRIQKVYPKVSPSKHAAEVLEDLKELTS